MNKDLMSKVLLLENRIIVRQPSAEEKTKGGILIPDNAQKKPDEGVVIAIGPGLVADNAEKVPMILEIGDYVIYGKQAGIPIKIDGEEVRVMRENDVLLVLYEKSVRKPPVITE